MNKMEKLTSILFILLLGACGGGSTSSPVSPIGNNPVSSSDYPIGIPAAWTTPTVTAPARPSDWSSEITGYYYIDFNSGSNSNTYGTPSAPRKTLPSPIHAGSYVEITGDYHDVVGGAIKIYGEGTGDAWEAGVKGPVWVVGRDANNRMEFSGSKVVLSGSYVYLEYAFFHSGSRLQLGSFVAGNQVDHILVRNIEIEGLPTDGSGGLFSIVGLSSDPASNIIAYNSNFHSTGSSNPSTDTDARGVAIGAYTTNVWILENSLSDASGGLQVEAQTGFQSTTHHIYIGKNEVFNVAQAGIAVKYALDVIISQNDVYDIVDTTWSPSKCVGFQYAPDRVWILFNELHRCNIGIRGGSDNSDSIKESVYIIGNLIHDISISGTSAYGETIGKAFEINNGLSPRYIINNTIYDVESGINNAYYSSELVIDNNIISQVSLDEIYLEAGYSTGSNSSISRTLFDNPASIVWSDGVSRTLADFQSTFNKCSGCIAESPLFVNPAIGIFSLQSSSRAINSGSQNSAYDLFQTLYSQSIKVDFNGNARPANSADWDIGAFEYVATP